MPDGLKTATGAANDVAADIGKAEDALAAAATGPEQPAAESKWYIWRKSGTALIAYLLDSEVHTFAFSVAANAIISFIPFVVLLYTLALSVFHSQAMKGVVDDMVNYFLPSATKQSDWLATTIVSEAVLPLLKHHGAQLFSLPSAFTAPTGRAHWETLLRARAIENLCYVVAPAQAGLHTSGRETYGDSLIVDYWGQVLSRLAKGTGVITADIDLASQAESRARFPALDNRQLGVTGAAAVLT